jgi:hypothetical protein
MPKYSSEVTPTIAVVMANNQALSLDESPILTKSDTAPMVQKLVLFTTYPRINPNIDV